MIARVYRKLQGFSGDSKDIKEITTVYRLLIRFTVDCKGLQGITRVYGESEGVTRYNKRIIGDYKS